MNYYRLKFEREAKDNPTHWIIVPNPNRPGYFQLTQVRGF